MHRVGILYFVLLLSELASITILTTQQRVIQNNPSSNHIAWTRTWGGKYRDYAYDVVFVDGALFVTGDSYSYKSGPVNIFILKYSSDGEFAWNETYPLKGPIMTLGTSDHASREEAPVSSTANLNTIYTMGRGLASDGNSLYICGISIRDNSSYSLLLKFDMGGHIAWMREWQPGYDAKSTGVALDGSGNIFVTGYEVVSASMNHEFLLKYNGEGNLLFSKVFDTDYTETRGASQ